MQHIDWNIITENQGKDYLDFSVNINPLGIPEAITLLAESMVKVSGIYPDPECNVLREVLSDRYGIAKYSIICGNGADDILFRLILSLRPKHALVIEPTYEEYSRMLQITGCSVDHYVLSSEDGFIADSRLLNALKEYDIVLLCNPNNPTGCLIPDALLNNVIDQCHNENIVLVIDECFIEFLPDWKKLSLKKRASVSSDLIIIDAFTKKYSLAGFRLGFCVTGNEKLINEIKQQGQDYAVSTPAQYAGLCALKDSDYLDRTYELINRERIYIMSELDRLNINYAKSELNYLLCWNDDLDMRDELLHRGIKVRDCSKFYGLNESYCRISLRTHNDNVKLIQILSNIFNLE